MPDIQFNDRYWLIPKGAKTIFAAAEVTPEIQDGKLILGPNTSIDLAQSRAKSSMGTVRFTVIDGESNKRGPFVYLYNPKLNMISWLFMFSASGKSKQFANAVNGFSQVDA